MKKGGGNSEQDGSHGRKNGGQNFIQNKNKMKRNMQRLGGRGGLSLEAFANAGTRNDNYNPALIKKQKEFYRNAKYVQKFKRSLKQHQLKEHSTAEKYMQGGSETKEDRRDFNSQNKTSKTSSRSLKELYEKKREEEEKVKREREAIIEAKKEKIRVTEDRRKSLKEKMYKKTRFGQPVMKYRIEHLLDTIQGSTS